MLLTPFECAVIMTVIEGKLVSVRSVYYRVNERYDLLGVKIGKNIRINESQIEEYYEFRGFKVRRSIDELAGYFKCGRNRKVLKCQQNVNLPIDFIKAAKCVQSRERTAMEHKKNRFKKLHRRKRNNKQLEFKFH